MGSSNLANAKKTKNDEFYTQYQDIEKEIQDIKEMLKMRLIIQILTWVLLIHQAGGLRWALTNCMN